MADSIDARIALCCVQGCDVPIPRPKLMCDRHYSHVPYSHRVEISEAYQPGQIDGKVPPSMEYIEAVKRAVAAITPGQRPPPDDQSGDRVEA